MSVFDLKRFIFFLAAIFIPSYGICDDTILATANYPITGVLSGQGGDSLAIGQFQYPAVDFTLTQITQITAIGGNIHANSTPQFAGNLMLFGAIATVDSTTGFPTQLPTNFQPLAETTFSPPTSFLPSDTIVPLSITLGPGKYALIFGSNRFGATGSGGMPFMSGDNGTPSYFIGAIHNTLGTDQNWDNTDPNVHNIRFVIMGNVVPEPSTLFLLGLGTLSFLASCKWLPH